MAVQYTVSGPTKLSYAGNNLGFTKGGITIQCRTNWKPITADEFGDQPADYILAGKSAIIRGVFLDMALIAAAKPMIGKFLQLRNDADNDDMVGKLIFDGETDTATNLSQSITITEEDGSVWIARECIPKDPEQILLSSTQENQIPLEFLVIPDEDGKLFYAWPNYIN